MKRPSVSSFTSGAFMILYAPPYLLGGGSVVFGGIGSDGYFVESVFMMIGTVIMTVAAWYTI